MAQAPLQHPAAAGGQQGHKKSTQCSLERELQQPPERGGGATSNVSTTGRGVPQVCVGAQTGRCGQSPPRQANAAAPVQHPVVVSGKEEAHRTLLWMSRKKLLLLLCLSACWSIFCFCIYICLCCCCIGSSHPRLLLSGLLLLLFLLPAFAPALCMFHCHVFCCWTSHDPCKPGIHPMMRKSTPVDICLLFPPNRPDAAPAC
jgi:hypothetical protein